MKKNNPLYWLAALLAVALISCNKDLKPENNASLTLVNAMSDQPALLPLFDSSIFDEVGLSSTNILAYRSYIPNNHLTVPSEEHSIFFYSYVTPVKKEPAVAHITLHPQTNNAHTLLLLGTKAAPDHLILDGLPPFHPAQDSSFGIRFVNIAPDKKAITVKLTGIGIDPRPSDLAFKESSGYKIIQAKNSLSDITIEIFEKSIGPPVRTYTLTGINEMLPSGNRWRYKNFTFVWLPKNIDGTWADSPFLIQDFR